MDDIEDIVARLERLELSAGRNQASSSECTLKFRLDDPDGEYAFKCAMAARDMSMALHDIAMKCRSILKHGEPSKETRAILEEIREIACSTSIDD